MPSQNVDFQPIDFGDLTVFSSNQERASRTELTDMTALQVARIGNRHIPAQHPVLMDVTECPVLVTFGLQFSHGARGVLGVLGVAFERRMKYADVQPPGHGLWVTWQQVLSSRSHLEAATM